MFYPTRQLSTIHLRSQLLTYWLTLYDAWHQTVNGRSEMIYNGLPGSVSGDPEQVKLIKTQ